MKPRVSVLCITFNQSKYIQRALDSFLEQKTNFDYEILVHDDASTDGTTDILKEYAKQYPEKIRLFTEKENQYSKHNFEFIKNLFISARGKYIAVCEGDDYWTDVTKLQQQVDFLDKNDDYAICFHTSEVIYEDSEKSSHLYPDVQDKSWYTLEELFKINYIPTASVMYRRQNYETFISDMMPGDWYMHLFHAQFGKIKFIDKKMSVYRKHENGVFYDYDQERDKIWIKHGLDYAKFYKELLAIYKKTPRYMVILKELLYQHMSTLVGVDKKYKTNILESVYKVFPEEERPFVEYQYSQIEKLTKEKDELRVELLKAGDERYKFEVIADKATHALKDKTAQFENESRELHAIKRTKYWKIRGKITSLINGREGW